jgi:hypothetical protein
MPAAWDEIRVFGLSLPHTSETHDSTMRWK